jgi:hypothetical protein
MACFVGARFHLDIDFQFSTSGMTQNPDQVKGVTSNERYFVHTEDHLNVNNAVNLGQRTPLSFKKS